MRILVIGGTRFIGVYLTQLLMKAGHEVVLFNRGNHSAPSGVGQIIGDRTDSIQLKEKLAQETFDVVFDNNGRELTDTQPLADIFQGRVKHFVYMSSAGVYLKSEQMPHIEGDTVDPQSRHKGKHETEAYLQQLGIPFLLFVLLISTGRKIIILWKVGFLIELCAIARFRFLVMVCTSPS